MVTDIDLTQAEYYMEECFELASKALGQTSPNPIVGAIVLDKSGNPVGKGVHVQAGKEHAELLALREAGALSIGGSLVVNLEPCCHEGKTPPCTDEIIKSGVKQVIFSNVDRHYPSGNRGEDILRKNNIKIVKGILEEEGKELNKFFFKWATKKLPWITLKQAQTIDGKVSMKDKAQRWLTCDESKVEVHKLRNTYDAILTTASTVLVDNPKLTVRNIENANSPIKIILDAELKTDANADIYKGDNSIILVTKKGCSTGKLQEYKQVNNKLQILECAVDSRNHVDLVELFQLLAKKNILSVMVECGPILAGNLLQQKLVDQYIVFLTPEIFNDTDQMRGVSFNGIGKGVTSIKFKFFNYKLIGNDFMLDLRAVL